MALPPPVLMSPSKPGSRGVTTYTRYLWPSLKRQASESEAGVNQLHDLVNGVQSAVCALPVRSDDALGDGVSYLVEDVSVVCTADEELVLEERQNPTHVFKRTTNHSGHI